MKRIVDEFLQCIENPPKAPETRDAILRKKEIAEDLKNSLIKISRYFFSMEQLKELKTDLMEEYEDVLVMIKTGRILKEAFSHMFPGAETQIINLDEEGLKNKLKKIEGLLRQVCEIITTIEIAETTGIIKPNA